MNLGHILVQYSIQMCVHWESLSTVYVLTLVLCFWAFLAGVYDSRCILARDAYSICSSSFVLFVCTDAGSWNGSVANESSSVCFLYEKGLFEGFSYLTASAVSLYLSAANFWSWTFGSLRNLGHRIGVFLIAMWERSELVCSICCGCHFLCVTLSLSEFPWVWGQDLEVFSFLIVLFVYAGAPCIVNKLSHCVFTNDRRKCIASVSRCVGFVNRRQYVGHQQISKWVHTAW